LGREQGADVALVAIGGERAADRGGSQAELSRGKSRQTMRIWPVSTSCAFTWGQTSLWKLAQCEQVREKNSVTTFGAAALPLPRSPSRGSVVAVGAAGAGVAVEAAGGLGGVVAGLD
jgi:hypothetical protein